MGKIEEDLFGAKPHRQTINQKKKGNTNESRVCHLLSDWTGKEFVRVPMSGGLRWQNRMNVCGDVISTDPNFYFPFSVETKHVANLGLRMGMPMRSNSIVFKYFAQCERDAIVAKKIPFLIIRQNGMVSDSYYIFFKVTYLQWIKFLDKIAVQFKEDTTVHKPFLVGFYSLALFKYIDCQTLISILDESTNSNTRTS